MPDFNYEKIVKLGFTNTFELNQRIKDDYFGFIFKGYLQVDVDGEYTFTIGSDDGSKLYINDQILINNDGTHGYREKSGKIKLSSGLNLIKVEFFEKTHSNQLKAYWEGTDFGRQLIPES